MRTGIVVLGMHRSGTSAISRVLSLLGADLPNGAGLQREDNPKGFWESWQAQQLNDELLSRLDRSWDSLAPLPENWMAKAIEWKFDIRAEKAILSEFGQSSLFVLKEPRICTLFPLWHSAMERGGARPRIVIPLRNPFEVAGSLARRDQLISEQGLSLWLEHVLAAERETRDLPRVFITFPDLLNDWRAVAEKISKGLGIAWPCLNEESSAEIDAFLDAGMRHHRKDDKEVFSGEEKRSWIRDAYSALFALTTDAYDIDAIATLDRVYREMSYATPLYTNGLEYLGRAGKELLRLRVEFEREVLEKEKSLEISSDLESQLQTVNLELETVSSELEIVNSALKTVGSELKTVYSELDRVTSREERVRERLQELQSRFSDTRFAEIQLAKRLNEVQTSVAWGMSSPVKRLEKRYPEKVRKLYTLPKMLGWAATGRLSQNRAIRNDAVAIIHSGIFNESEYLHRYPDIALTGYSPLYHWLLLGSKEGKDPHPLFFTSWYLQTYPDVAESGENPLVNYLTKGSREGRSPSPLFDGEYYLQHASTELESGVSSLVHYLNVGGFEGKNPNPFFDSAWYLQQNPDVAELGTNPLLHYLEHGAAEGRDPCPGFANNWYLEEYSHGIPKRMNPLIHFLTEGRDKKLVTHPEEYSSDFMDFEEVPEDGSEGAYIGQILSLPSKQHSNYKPYKEYENTSFDVKLLAFYLPQFHPIPENDDWWGRGFTEWTNVAKAVPQFVGHDQPKLPAELGYYDLRLSEIQTRQVELAQNYGLAGFCFHYYWFGGRKLLDRPLNQFIENKELDFGFCVSWANENWTRSWDGLDKEILVAQDHSAQDDIEFIKEMEPLFKDRRYIRVAGRPLLLVYRVSLLPDPVATADRWRKYCIRAGLGNPYLAFVRFDDTDPTSLGFDAAVEFPPHKVGGRLPPINSKFRFFHEDYQGTVLSYDGMTKRARNESAPSYPLLRGVCPSWDNEARRPGKGLCFYGSTPGKYQAWLTQACRYADEHPVEGERLVFVNAWNEWAEGAYIEPDRSFGYAYLDATRSALMDWDKS